MTQIQLLSIAGIFIIIGLIGGIINILRAADPKKFYNHVWSTIPAGIGIAIEIIFIFVQLIKALMR